MKNHAQMEKFKTIISFGGLILFPAFHFYLLEAYTHNGFSEVRPWSQLFNILLFELAAWILFLWVGNVTWALWIEGVLAMAAGLINSYIYAFRSLPFAPWDIFSIGTAASVLGNYDFMPSPRVLAAAAGFLAVLFLEGRCHFAIEKRKRKFWILLSLVFCVIFILFSRILQQEDFQNRHRMYNKLFTPVYMWQVNGFALTMVMEMPFLEIEKPAGYQSAQAKTALSSYKEEAAEEEEQVLPNIIVIMDEAFSDLAVLGDFTASEDVMPFFHSLQNEDAGTVTGYLNVSVCGGNTANTEFEFLTGNTMAFLPQGSIPYQQYISREIFALPWYLKELGYETHAMHPYYGGGWERDSVYPLLGFEHIKFLNDFTNRDPIRNYVSDRACMEEILQTFEQKKEDAPLFLFQVTMQNHGSYSDLYENFSPHIQVEGAPSFSLSSYLSLVRETDEAFKELLADLKEEEEAVIVVFFGDHQPNNTVVEPILRLNGKSSRTLPKADTDMRYQVPYVIWGNDAFFESSRMRESFGFWEDTSANYLGAKLLRLAGIPRPAYFKFLEEFEKSYPILSAVRQEKGGEAVMDLEEYKKLQYYQMFDGNRTGI